MTQTFGSGRYGQEVFGTDFDLYSPNTTAIDENWPFDQVYPDTKGATLQLLLTHGKALDRLDDRIEEVKSEQRLDSATWNELETLAREVNVTRQTFEADNELRFRAQIRKAITRSDGTLDGLTTFLAIIFDDDAVRSMSIDTVADAPVVQLFIPSDVMDDAPLTPSDMEDAFTDVLPHADQLRVITDDTFILGESGDQGLGKGKLR